jgi:hypothetical protein
MITPAIHGSERSGTDTSPCARVYVDVILVNENTA